MLKFFINEEFKEVVMEGKLQLRYAISNYGRLISFTESFQTGKFLKGSMIEGYRIFRYKVRNDDNKVCNKHHFFYRLVATYFLEKSSEDQIYILHLDRNKTNDTVINLKWATKEEMLAHQNTSPKVLENRKKLIEHNIKRDGQKLTATRVIYIKRLLNDPKRTIKIKQLAAKFGVSEMQIYRIKTGENWGHIEV